ncbi:MAG: zinc-dependent metalloprotease [Actinomycetota bacterium]
MSSQPAASEPERPPGAQLIDLSVASKVAAKVAAAGALEGSYLLDDLEEDLAALIAEAEPLVAEETGSGDLPGATPRVLSRGQWADANLESMLVLIDPLLDKVETRMAQTENRPGAWLARMASGPALGVQMGTVLGILSRHVLGQYDLIVGGPHEVWFVGPNLVAAERRFGFVPRDFRLWVVLHELTHRAQFEGTPWLRAHFLGMVKDLLGSLEVDARVLLSRAIDSARQPGRGSDPLPFRFLEPEQREVFDRLQAFMTVIEGHGNFVMDRIGTEVVPTQDRMRRTLRDIQSASGPMQKFMSRLLGLDLKRRQYEEGQRFFDAVFEQGGSAAVRATFAAPAALPTLREVRSPQAWLDRTNP